MTKLSQDRVIQIVNEIRKDYREVMSRDCKEINQHILKMNAKIRRLNKTQNKLTLIQGKLP